MGMKDRLTTIALQQATELTQFYVAAISSGPIVPGSPQDQELRRKGAGALMCISAADKADRFGDAVKRRMESWRLENLAGEARAIFDELPELTG